MAILGYYCRYAFFNGSYRFLIQNVLLLYHICVIYSIGSYRFLMAIVRFL